MFVCVCVCVCVCARVLTEASPYYSGTYIRTCTCLSTRHTIDQAALLIGAHLDLPESVGGHSLGFRGGGGEEGDEGLVHLALVARVALRLQRPSQVT